MIRLVFAVALVLSSVTWADSIYEMCMSKETSVDIQSFFSVYLGDPSLPLNQFSPVGEEESCHQMAARAKHVEDVSFDHPMRDLKFLVHFPKATNVTAMVDGLEGGIEVGGRDNLKKIFLDGHFQITKPGELAKSKDLKSFNLVGRKKGGFIDLKEFTVFENLTSLAFIGVKVKNAKVIEQFKNLEAINLKNCDLDSKIDFSKRPEDFVSIIENVSYSTQEP